MGSGVYFVHCVVLPNRHITEPMGVNETSLNVDKYDNQNKVSISHQFLISDCSPSYLMAINDAYIQANTLVCTKTVIKKKLVTTEKLYRYLSLFINTKLCYS